MNKILTITILFLFCQNVFGQRYNVPLNLPNYDRKPLHFGFLIGLNTLDFKITPITNTEDNLFVMQSQNQKGFNLGVISNKRLGNNFDLRFIPTLSLAERRILYTIKNDNILISENKKLSQHLLSFLLALNINHQDITMVKHIF